MFGKVEEAGTKPVPLREVLRSLEIDLSRTAPVTLSNIQLPLIVGGKEREEVTALRTGIANMQCYDVDPETKKPDPSRRSRSPLIPVVTGALQLTVQGQLTTTGTITVSVPLSAGGSIAREAQQQIMLPTTLVALPNLPAFYLGQQMSNIQNAGLMGNFKVEQKKVDAATTQVGDYVSRSLDATSALGTIVSDALDEFDHKQDTYCQGRDSGNGPPIVVVVPAVM